MKGISEKACMIRHGEKTICIFPSEAILRVLGKKYTLLIIGLLGNEKGMGFNKILESIGRPRANLLSMRFKELEVLNLIQRKVIDRRPLVVEYSLTDRGCELRDNLIQLFDWIEKN
ncbi:MAG: helix-turn-helix transcriptional regulator [Thermoplasmata archaeon]|nr:helix-turn-helix transcriptional regulator [Candidatus Sysuiplasma acidicola]MBX8646189.1 helix-turn-helix transcriptional regulator [Candidatus Sysuiplasma acidicola]MDH2905357.1 helix-turn-helix domain-containing protein [Methanomassiliicoccales archaeon]